MSVRNYWCPSFSPSRAKSQSPGCICCHTAIATLQTGRWDISRVLGDFPLFRGLTGAVTRLQVFLSACEGVREAWAPSPGGCGSRRWNQKRSRLKSKLEEKRWKYRGLDACHSLVVKKPGISCLTWMSRQKASSAKWRSRRRALPR